MDYTPPGSRFRRDIWLYALLLALILVTTLLRLHLLGEKDLWYDEAVIHWIAREDTQTLIERNATMNSAPPLYPAVVAFILKFSDQEWALRLPSALAGAAAVLALYALIRSFQTRSVAILTSLLLALSPIHIQYSQELREYTASFLATALIMLLFVRFIRTKKHGYLVLLSLTMACSLYLHYGSAIVIASVNVIYLVHWWTHGRQTRNLAVWIASQAVVALAVLGVYQLSLRYQFASDGFASSGYLESSYWNGTVDSLLRLAFWNTYQLARLGYNAGLISLNGSQPALAFVALVLLGSVCLFTQWRSRALMTSIICVPIIMTFVLAIIGIFPYTGSRQNFYLVPNIYLVASAGLAYVAGIFERSQSRSLRVAGIAVFTLVFIVPGIQRLERYYRAPGRAPFSSVLDDYNRLIRIGDSTIVEGSVFYVMQYYSNQDETEWIVEQYTDDWRHKVAETIDSEERSWLICSGDCENWSATIPASKTGRIVSSTTNSDGFTAYSLMLIE